MGGGVAIFPSAPVRVKSNDVEHEYHQDPDLYYLCGFGEPDSVGVLMPSHPEHPFVLFVRPRDPDKEIWTGRRAGPEGAVRDYGANVAFPIGELESRLPSFIENAPRLYYRIGHNRGFDEKVLAALEDVRSRSRTGVQAPSEIIDPGKILHEHRLVKGPDEIEHLRRACEISCKAHRAAMAACSPDIHEYELEAVIEYVFRRSGSTGPGYPSIVGAGANATILHYSTNHGPITKSDMVLIDAGCEWQYYTADITRTFPADGRFDRDQRDLYEIVLEAQLAAIDEVRPGVPFQAYHDRAVRVLTEGMVRVGLLEGDVAELIEKDAYKRFFPHRTGHWLGMDVHDVGLYQLEGQSRRLEPGMVLTVEPGLYIQPDDGEAPERFRGIGIRIEDDVLVTEEGREVLSADAPKTIEDVERAVAQNRAGMP
jgi:Xaa-Pro aminopeptidase